MTDKTEFIKVARIALDLLEQVDDKQTTWLFDVVSAMAGACSRYAEEIQKELIKQL